MSPLRSVPCAALLICALITPTALAEESPPTLEDVLERWAEAVGGRAAIERLTTRTYVGEEIVDLAYRDPQRVTASLRIDFMVPDRWRMVTVDGTETHVTVCNGITGWRQKPEGFELDDSICGYLDGLLFDPRAPLRMRDYYTELTLTGTRNLEGGKKVYTIAASAPDRKQRDFYFDVDSGLLVQVGGNRLLQDYREVDGVLVPHRFEISRKGGWAAYEFDRVTHGEAMDDVLFAPDTFAGIDDRRVLPGGSFTAHNVSGHENHMRDFLEAIRSDPQFETTIHEVSEAGISVCRRRK